MNSNLDLSRAPQEDGPSLPSFEPSGQSILQRFEQMVDEYPANVAVKDHERTLTYRDLNAKANRLAHVLLESGSLQEGMPVAFLLGHETAAIVALMGILKTGHPYVALSPTLPAEVLKWMLSDSASTGLVSAQRHASLASELTRGGRIHSVYLDDSEPTTSLRNPQIYVSPNAPFAIYYTSASTGDSKGVVDSHSFILNQTRYRIQEFRLSPRDHVALLVSLGFSYSWTMIMDGLLNGGRVCMYDFMTYGPQKALAWISLEQITILAVTPTVLRAIFEHAPKEHICRDLRTVMVAAEIVKAADIALFKAHTAEHCTFYVIYGSTEGGVVTTYALGHEYVLTDEYPPVGHPIPGYDIMLLDEDDQVVKPGNDGEIVVRSRYLSSGYWRRPDLTSRKFVRVPGDPELMSFYTGDVGRLRPDGALEFRGRKDTQVKIRGIRIELSEVELVLSGNPAVKDTFVVTRPARHDPDQLQLIAYIVLKVASSTTAAELRQYALRKLPEYAIPAFFVFLDRLPINPNGKVDKRALPDVPERLQLSTDDLPSDEVEQKLIEIWSRLLRLDRIGAGDNFFELGGDSLLCLSMTLEVERQLSKMVPQAFFKEPTLRNLARLLFEAPEGESQPKGQYIRKDRWYTTRGHQTTTRNGWSRFYRRTTTRLALLVDTAFVFQWVLSRFTRHLTFDRARSLVLWVADRAYLRKTIFFDHRRLFRRWLASLNLVPENPEALQRMYIANNLLFRLLDALSPFREPRTDLLEGGAAPLFFRERRTLIDETPIDQLDDQFPIEGLLHLQEAIRRGLGVILVSLHGMAGNSRTAQRILARRLGIAPIHTVTYNAPFEDGDFDEADRDRLSAAVASSLSGEVALQGERLLEHGAVIHIIPDFDRRVPGPTYRITVGNSTFAIKAGFAHLALNTGASVLPVFGRFLENGRLVLSILPALETPQGARDDQIHSLIEQYEAFVNAALRNHPEMMTWEWLRQHFGRRRVWGS